MFLNTNLYLDMFIEESREHINSMNENLLLLEKDPDNEEVVQELFRSAHTIKGMAATMGYEEMTTLTHELEGVLDQVRNHGIRVNGRLMDSIFHCMDHMESILFAISDGGDGKVDIEKDLKDLQEALLQCKEREETVEDSYFFSDIL